MKSTIMKEIAQRKAKAIEDSKTVLERFVEGMLPTIESELQTLLPSNLINQSHVPIKLSTSVMYVLAKNSGSTFDEAVNGFALLLGEALGVNVKVEMPDKLLRGVGYNTTLAYITFLLEIPKCVGE